jgi:hypothetical protein
VSWSSDLSTLQGSPQKHIDNGTLVGKGSGSKAVPVNGPFLNFDKLFTNISYYCWAKGEHATIRSTTSSPPCTDEGWIHRTHQGRPRAPIRRRPVRPPSPTRDETKAQSKSMDLLFPHHQGRPMCDSGHRVGPRVDRSNKDRVCNKVYHNDCL